MPRTLLVGLAALSLLSLAVPAASGKMIAPPPISLRVANADVVIVGKVTAIEDRTVRAPRWPGDKEGGEFHVAVVKVEEALVGAKGLTHLKVCFLPSGPRPRG